MFGNALFSTLSHSDILRSISSHSYWFCSIGGANWRHSVELFLPRFPRHIVTWCCWCRWNDAKSIWTFWSYATTQNKSPFYVFINRDWLISQVLLQLVRRNEGRREAEPMLAHPCVTWTRSSGRRCHHLSLVGISTAVSRWVTAPTWWDGRVVSAFHPCTDVVTSLVPLLDEATPCDRVLLKMYKD